MERATFIVESTGERIPCLLNPEHLTFTRTAGLRRPQAGSGALTGLGRSDEPLLHTGGGRTELELRLLFDVTLVTDPTPVTDVRQLTSRLWGLAENQPTAGGQPAGVGGPGVGSATTGSAGAGAAVAAAGLASGDPTSANGTSMSTTVAAVRMVWGRQLNYLAVIDAIAERLERFDASGAPTRSWLFLRLVRVPDLRPTAVDAPIGGIPLGDELAAAAETAAADPQGVTPCSATATPPRRTTRRRGRTSRRTRRPGLRRSRLAVALAGRRETGWPTARGHPPAPS